MPQVTGDSAAVGVPAVLGTSVVSRGVQGSSTKDHGVVGQSKDGTGVVGVSENQRGIEGRSTKDHGVVGQSKDGTGVVGVSENQRGVEGRSTKDHGVVGQSKQGAGVFGVSETSNGIEGRSGSGIGVRGKGGRLAGLFEGAVEITGSLTVKGVNVEALLQRIIELEEAVAALRKKPIDVPTISLIPQIRVTREGSGSGSVFVVEGSGFLPSKLVTIRVVDDALAARTFSQSADASGKIAARLPISCISGLMLHFSATDSRPNPSDITGVLFSNTFTTICS